MTGLRGLKKQNKGKPWKERKLLFLIFFSTVFAILSLTVLGGFIAYESIMRDENVISGGDYTSGLVEESTSTSSTTSSLTSTTSMAATSSTTTTSTTLFSTSTSTSTTTVAGVICSGLKVPEDLLDGSSMVIPQNNVLAVLCIKGFGQQRSYATIMNNLHGKEGITVPSITYQYSVGYVIYEPFKIDLDEILSVMGDYTVEVLIDGVKGD